MRTSVLGCFCVLAVVGCGVEVAGTDGAPEVTTAALGESSCLHATLTADATLVAGGGWQMSPTTYSNPSCSKAWVYETPGAIGTRASFPVWWTDRHPRTKTQCVNGSISVQVLSRTSTPTPVWSNSGTFTAPLKWLDQTQLCYFPQIDVNNVNRGHIEPNPPNQWEVFITYMADPTVANTFPADIGPVALPFSLSGRRVRLATQALTPKGSTQSVEVLF